MKITHRLNVPKDGSTNLDGIPVSKIETNMRNGALSVDMNISIGVADADISRDGVFQTHSDVDAVDFFKQNYNWISKGSMKKITEIIMKEELLNSMD